MLIDLIPVCSKAFKTRCASTASDPDLSQSVCPAAGMYEQPPTLVEKSGCPDDYLKGLNGFKKNQHFGTQRTFRTSINDDLPCPAFILRQT